MCTDAYTEFSTIFALMSLTSACSGIVFEPISRLFGMFAVRLTMCMFSIVGHVCLIFYQGWFHIFFREIKFQKFLGNKFETHQRWSEYDLHWMEYDGIFNFYLLDVQYQRTSCSMARKGIRDPLTAHSSVLEEKQMVGDLLYRVISLLQF